MILLIIRKLTTFRNSMPLLEAAATARSRRVLRNEHWMPFEWRLLSVVDWSCRRQTPSDKIRCVVEHSGHPFLTEILQLFRAQRKVAAKGGAFKLDEYFVQVSQCGRDY